MVTIKRTSYLVGLVFLFISFHCWAEDKKTRPLQFNETIPQLINDLGAKEEGNATCNTACAILVMKKDESVPALQKALKNKNDRIRYYAIRCLGEITTQKSRRVLITAFSNGLDDVREHAAYALTWHPHPDAEMVYIKFLNGKSRWHARHAINALGDIRSKAAIPYLVNIRDNPEGWYFYYAVVIALRKIESKELPKDEIEAFDLLKRSKFSRSIDEKQLLEAERIIRGDIKTVLPDVVDFYLWVTKGNDTYKIEPVIRDAGNLAYPYLRIGLRDKDENINHRIKDLIIKLGWQSEFKDDFL